MNLVARLLVLGLVAVLPSLFALASSQQEALRERRGRLEREALAQAELAGAEVAGALEAAHQFLLGRSQAGLAPSPGCDEAAVRSGTGLGRYAFFVVLDGDGFPACGGVPGAAGSIPGAVRHAAAEAAARRGFAVGRFGGAQGGVEPFLPLALPFDGTRGEPGGALVLGLSLEWLDARLAASPRPPGGAVLVADQDGTVLARAPGDRFRSGQALGPEWEGLLRSAGPGTTAARGGGRLIGHAPAGEGPARLFVAAELPAGAAVAGLDPAAWRGVLLDAVCVLLAAALVAAAAHRLVRAPALGLLAAARRRAGGDRAARADVREGPGAEFGQLARAFNALMDAEAEQRAELQRLNAALEARVEERTRALSETNNRLQVETAEREMAAASLRQAQKLQAVGQLAGGIAHEFNNLLTGVLGSLELLRHRTPADARAQQRLIGTALTAVQRGARLTSQLLSFSRKQQLNPEVTDLNAAIGGMERMLTATLGPGVRIELRLEPDLWRALVDPNGFEAAILNLALNSRDAMPNGGRLLIATANKTVGPDDMPGGLRPGDYVMVVLADSGAGMTVETLSRVFEPFFTTKPPGKGAGLGLSQVHGLVQQSDGDVRITSRPGEGTRVTLLLPRSPAPDPAARAPEASTPAGEILLVDDDDEVRDVTAMLLAEAGHRVHAAASAEEALRLLAKRGDAVRVLIADYAMPGMNGLELIALVRREWPGVAALLATGYADLSGLEEEGRASPDGVVRKPYQGRDLLARIGQALEEHRVRDAETA